MLTVKKEGILIEKTTLDFENEGVLNPAVIKEGNHVHLFYRAVSKGNYSSIGYCKLKGPLNVVQRNEAPVLVSEFSYESHGVEDPRIVKIEEKYFLTYTAYDGVNALGAIATSTDLIHWKKQGILVPQITYAQFVELTESIALNEKYYRYNNHEGMLIEEGKQILLWDKNIIFFPRKINGNLLFLHRIKPDIQIVVSIKSLDEITPEFWENYFLHLGQFLSLKT